MHITLWRLLWRGLILRCPICGKGKLFRRPFKMYDQCPCCEFPYERGEEGYFTSSMAINLVLSEFIVVGFTVPLSAMRTVSLALIWGIGIPMTVLLPFLFFHHSRSFWLSIDHFFNPVSREHLETRTRIFEILGQEQ